MKNDLTQLHLFNARCALCAKHKITPPDVPSDWHCFTTAGQLVYVCGDHFIEDPSHPTTFEQRYASVLKQLGITF